MVFSQLKCFDFYSETLNSIVLYWFVCSPNAGAVGDALGEAHLVLRLQPGELAVRVPRAAAADAEQSAVLPRVHCALGARSTLLAHFSTTLIAHFAACSVLSCPPVPCPRLQVHTTTSTN